MEITVQINGIIGEQVTRIDVAKQLIGWKDGDTIMLLIASPGGDVDEAFAIIDLLNGYKNKGARIIAKNNGNVMSAAVGIFLVADERYFDPNVGNFLIHNPWIETAGNARELIQRVKELKEYENRLIALYASRTGASEEVLRSYMDAEIYMEASDIEALGFAKIIYEPIWLQKRQWKAVAYIKNDTKMEKEKLTAIEKLVKLLANKLKVKAIVLTDINGKELDFGSITDEAEIVIGVTATVDGQPANGQYTLEQLNGGSVLTFENGVLIDMQPLQKEKQGQQASESNVEEKLAEVVELVTALYDEMKKESQELRRELAKIKATYYGQKFDNKPAEASEQKKIVKKFNI